MKTFTQVILPIILIVGLVFGITIVSNYTRSGRKPEDANKKNASALPLVFDRIANPPPKDEITYKLGLGKVSEDFPRWRTSYEVGEHSFFNFWFHNQNEQNVSLRFVGASCKCAEADLVVIPPDAWSRYVETTAVAGWPGMPALSILPAIGLAQLDAKISPLWQHVYHDSVKTDATVPGATSLTGPQLGILRVNFYGMASGLSNDATKKLELAFATQLPGKIASKLDIVLNYDVITPLFVSVDGRKDFEVNLGEIGPHSSVDRDIIFWSRTRSEMNLDISILGVGDNLSNIALSKPVPLTGEEFEAFARSMLDPEKHLVVRSAYRVRMHVDERREIEEKGKKVMKQLELGPLDFHLKTAVTSGRESWVLAHVSGMVRGGVRVIGDRVDFGAAFPRSIARSKQVLVISEQEGLDLELSNKECVPDYLEATLKQESENQGLKKWTLTVNIPEGKLYGSMSKGCVVLRTKDMQARKVRIPVRATTYDQ